MKVTSSIILKLLSFAFAFIVLDTLITYYGITLEWVPAYLETNVVYRLYGLDAFLLGKLVVGSATVTVFYIRLKDATHFLFKAYNMILLAFTSVSWFAVISNIIVIIDINYLIDIYYVTVIPTSMILLTLHGIWWMRLRP